MKVKRYEGKSEKEVMEKIKLDMGPEALILNIRRVEPKGFFSFFKSPIVEITATNDKLFTKVGLNSNAIEKVEEEKKTVISKEGMNAYSNKPIEQESKPTVKHEAMKNIEDKIDNLEAILKSVTEKLQSDVGTTQTVEKKYSSNIVKLFYDNMIRNEVLPEVADKILDGLEKESEKSNVNELVRVVYNRIIDLLGKPEEIKIEKNAGEPKVVVFVGPTGVGKTTTIAKVIATFILNNKKNVGLLTADTYRIAAVEQLKTYAEILGSAIEVVYSPEELEEKIQKQKEKDILFLDTAGRSHKNKEQFEELTKLLDCISKKEVYLVLSLPTKYRDLVDIIQKYSEILEEYKIIFTKMDETMGVGNILNIKMLTGKSFSYITFGQDVPDDIEVMNPEKIAKFLLGSSEK